MDCSPPCSSVHTGFSKQEYWSGLPIPSPGDLPNQGSNPGLLHCRWILYCLSHQGSPDVIISSVQLLSYVRLFATAWTVACQAFLSITNSWSTPKPMSIESVMPSNHLILCCPLLFPPSIFSNIRVFSNESALHIR